MPGESNYFEKYGSEEGVEMKIAVTGKGGVGKTTIAAILARLYSRQGDFVLAVDADPDANLAAAIGFSESDINKIQPLSSLSSFIEERTGARPGPASSQTPGPGADR